MVEMSFKRNVIRARGYRLSPEEIRVNRIVGVFNSFGEELSAGYIEAFARGQCDEDRGETMIVERNIVDVDGVSMDVVSVIVFKDLVSLQMFVLRHGKVYLRESKFYKGFPSLMN
jgi:hypothetical protein